MSPQAFTKYHSVVAAHFGYDRVHGYPCVDDGVIRMSSVRSSKRNIMNLYFLVNPVFGINWCRTCPQSAPNLLRWFKNFKGSLLSRKKMNISFLVVTHSYIDFYSNIFPVEVL